RSSFAKMEPVPAPEYIRIGDRGIKHDVVIRPNCDGFGLGLIFPFRRKEIDCKWNIGQNRARSQPYADQLSIFLIHKFRLFPFFEYPSNAASVEILGRGLARIDDNYGNGQYASGKRELFRGKGQIYPRPLLQMELLDSGGERFFSLQPCLPCFIYRMI